MIIGITEGGESVENVFSERGSGGERKGKDAAGG